MRKKFEKVLLQKYWKGNNLGMSVCSLQARSVPIRVRGRHQNRREGTEFEAYVAETDEPSWSGETDYVFLIQCTLDVLKADAIRTIVLLTSTERCSNHEFPQDQLKRCPARRTTTWRDTQSIALHGTAHWQTQTSSSCMHSPHFFSVIISAKEEEFETVG